MESPIKEQLCHPAGEFYGVNISVNVEGGLEVLQPHHEKARSSGVQELLEGRPRPSSRSPSIPSVTLRGGERVHPPPSPLPPSTC